MRPSATMLAAAWPGAALPAAEFTAMSADQRSAAVQASRQHLGRDQIRPGGCVCGDLQRTCTAGRDQHSVMVVQHVSEDSGIRSVVGSEKQIGPGNCGLGMGNGSEIMHSVSRKPEAAHRPFWIRYTLASAQKLVNQELWIERFVWQFLRWPVSLRQFRKFPPRAGVGREKATAPVPFSQGARQRESLCPIEVVHTCAPSCDAVQSRKTISGTIPGLEVVSTIKKPSQPHPTCAREALISLWYGRGNRRSRPSRWCKFVWP